MSAPFTQFEQPPFLQEEVSKPAPKPVEPTNQELDGNNSLWWAYAFMALMVFVAMMAMGLQDISAHSRPQQPAPTTSACPSGQVEVETVQGDVRTDSYCATQAAYEALVAEAEGQYAAALKNGKPVYQDWLTDHKLSPKMEKARETAAQKYLCQVDPDFGDGALYAATQAGLPERELDFAIGNVLITIDGYDPLDQACSNGKPVAPPRPPKPSPQPKDPSQDPAVNGNAPSGQGRNVPEPSAPTKERPGQPGDVQGP